MDGHILVPLDGSAVAERSLPWVASLARTLGSKVTLLQVTPWPPEWPAGQRSNQVTATAIQRIRELATARASAYLSAVQDRLVTDGVDAEPLILEGQPADVIVRAAERGAARMIVIGTHGRGGLSRALIGSVAQQVTKHTHVPTLLVRADAPDQQPTPRRVLVPLDGSALSQGAIPHALEIAAGSADLILVRVVQPAITVVSTGFDGGASVVDEVTTLELVRQAESYLDRVVQPLRATHHVETAVRTGDPAIEIRAAAAERDADLIVMTTHGRGGLGRWAMGSVSDQLIRTAAQPVLLLNPRATAAETIAPVSVLEASAPELVQISPDDTVAVGIRKLMRSRRASLPVVDNQGAVIGVFSEHDALAWHTRYMEQAQADSALLDPSRYREHARTDHIAAVMTAPATVLDTSAPLADAIQLSVQHRFGRMPVVHEGTLVGSIGRGEMLAALRRRIAERLSERTDAP